MKRMQDAKTTYIEVEIPVELSQRISREVEQSDKRRRNKMILKKTGRTGMISAAAVAAVFTIGLNSSVTFAKAVDDLPVIGGIAKVLTFRSYERETEAWKVSVDIPGIDMISEDFNELEASVNSEIYKLCEAYAEEAKVRAEEYRQAFLETGGTEEEWVAHNIEIKVWYEVKAQTEQYLSLVIQGAESWNSANSKVKYYNFDLEKGRVVGLTDVLGENYAQIAKAQIEEQVRESGTQLLVETIPEINENTMFYMNESGHPVIVFEKYEIVPGSAGMPEFEMRP